MLLTTLDAKTLRSTSRLRFLSEDVQYRICYYPRAQAATSYILANLHEELSLVAIAERVGMSPTAFSRYFAKKVGITVSSLIRTLRIEAALERMQSGNLFVTQLAWWAGYRDHSTFSRAFKRVTGHSPREYQRRFLGEERSVQDREAASTTRRTPRST